MRSAFILLLIIFVVGCSTKVEKQVEFLEIDDFASYQSIGKSSPELRKAAAAVVRVNYSGTGFFISENGILMTNNHIVSGENCPASGCYIDLDWHYQSDVPYDESNSKELFAKPLYTSAEFDFTVLQILESDGGERISSPDFLELAPKTASELIDQELAIIGHPLSELKKIKKVFGYGILHGYIQLSDYVFGGNSGSPITDLSGKVVGILHSGQDGTYSISPNGIQGWAAATASADILRLIGGDSGSLKKMSVNSEVVSSQFVDIDSENFDFASSAGLLLSAKRLPKGVNNITEKFAEKYDKRYKACSGWLSDNPEMDIDPFSFGSLTRYYCLRDLRLMDCVSSADYKYCPDSEGRKKWQAAMELALAQGQQRFKSHNSSIVRILQRLEPDKEVRDEMPKKMLVAYVEQSGQNLDFDLAQEMIFEDLHDFKLGENAGSVADFVLDFRRNKYHSKFLYSIGLSHLSLYKKGILKSEARLKEVFRYLLTHRDLTAADRFSLESYAHRWRLLKVN